MVLTKEHQIELANQQIETFNQLDEIDADGRAVYNWSVATKAYLEEDYDKAYRTMLRYYYSNLFEKASPKTLAHTYKVLSESAVNLGLDAEIKLKWLNLFIETIEKEEE